jgi:hypothetical protein
MRPDDDLYAFAFRGQLAKQAAEAHVQLTPVATDGVERIASRLPFKLMDDSIVGRAREMAVIYAAIASIEDLAAILVTHQEKFEPIIPDAEWAKQILKTVERSRNIIMHSGYLEREDTERLGIAMRDWLTQVGG